MRANKKSATAKCCKHLKANFQVTYKYSSRSCFPPMTCIGFDKEMKMKRCHSPSDAIRGRVAERMRKLITSAKKVAMGEYIAGERFLVASE